MESNLDLYNCNEHLEVLLGAFKARVAPFNLNDRYTEATAPTAA